MSFQKKGREVALAALIKCKLSRRYGICTRKNCCGSVMSIVTGETVEYVVHGPSTFVA
jgi:hypothetical protein